MTDSSTPCLPPLSDPAVTPGMTCLAGRCPGFLRTFLTSLLVVLAVGLASPARAAEVEVRNPQIQVSDDGLALSADFLFDLGPQLDEAVSRGIVLPFVVEFEMIRPRWYWFDERLVQKSLSLKLSYHALTRQYRLTNGSLHQSFQTLEEALRVLSHLRNWTVLERNQLNPGDTYQGALRLRLDVSQLPKPFQVTALANRDWSVSSDWQRFAIIGPNPPPPAPAAPPNPPSAPGAPAPSSGVEGK